MKQLFSAFQFLTILPLGRYKKFEAPKTIPYFSVVGLFIGLIVASGDYVFSILTNDANGQTRDVINDIAKAIIDDAAADE